MNRFKISGFADEINDSIEKQAEVLRSLEMNYLELRSGNGKNVAEYTLKEAEAITDYLAGNGISVSALGSPIGKIPITDDFAPHYKTFQHVAELSKVFKTPYIRMFSFFIPEGENPDQYQDEVLRRMDQMINYATQEKVILLHENEKDIYGDIASRCLNLFKHLSCDSFQATFDFANFVQCNQDTLEAYEMLRPYITYIHIKDALLANSEVVPAGTGDGKLLDILKLLDKSGFDGYYSLEPHLTDFAGLKFLEKDPAKRKMNDQEAAFRLAHESFIGLLKQL